MHQHTDAWKPLYLDPAGQIERLTKELRKWEAPFDPEQFAEAQQQAKNGGDTAAYRVYVIALEHALKHPQEAELALRGALKKIEIWLHDIADGQIDVQPFIDSARAALSRASGGSDGKT